MVLSFPIVELCGTQFRFPRLNNASKKMRLIEWNSTAQQSAQKNQDSSNGIRRLNKARKKTK